MVLGHSRQLLAPSGTAAIHGAFPALDILPQDGASAPRGTRPAVHLGPPGWWTRAPGAESGPWSPSATVPGPQRTPPLLTKLLCGRGTASRGGCSGVLLWQGRAHVCTHRPTAHFCTRPHASTLVSTCLHSPHTSTHTPAHTCTCPQTPANFTFPHTSTHTSAHVHTHLPSLHASVHVHTSSQHSHTPHTSSHFCTPPSSSGTPTMWLTSHPRAHRRRGRRPSPLCGTESRATGGLRRGRGPYWVGGASGHGGRWPLPVGPLMRPVLRVRPCSQGSVLPPPVPSSPCRSGGAGAVLHTVFRRWKGGSGGSDGLPRVSQPVSSGAGT